MATKTKAAKVAKAQTSELVGFRVDPAKAARAKKMAEREGLTLTQVLRVMLDAYLAGRFKVELSAGPVAPAVDAGELPGEA